MYKHIYMITAKKIFIYLLPAVFLVSCTKDFQKLNATQDKPSSTTVKPLVNGVISSLLLDWTEQASIHND